MPEKESPKFKLPYPTSAGEVKVGATDFEELALKLDTLLGEKVLIVKKYAGSGTLASGELAIQEETGKTFTLPSAATANQIIGIFSKVAETKITSASETFGPGFKAAAWKLSTGQGALLQSDGVNWLFIAGEYKHEQSYLGKDFSKAEAETGVEPSSTHDAFVVLFGAGGPLTGLTVGGVAFASPAETMSVLVPAGQKWKTTVACHATTLLR